MAKMFYTAKEAGEILHCADEGLKAYAREGRLREFRDGPRCMYKADQVDELKKELYFEQLQPPMEKDEELPVIELAEEGMSQRYPPPIDDTGTFYSNERLVEFHAETIHRHLLMLFEPRDVEGMKVEYIYSAQQGKYVLKLVKE